MGDRTRVQIECPHIIQKFPVDDTTKDEELGTDHRHGMAATTDGPMAIDHDTSPLLRYWSATNSNQLDPVLTSKDRTCRADKANHLGAYSAPPGRRYSCPRPKSKVRSC